MKNNRDRRAYTFDTGGLPESLQQIFDRPIAFNRAFVAFGGIAVALFLSRAVYWQRRSKSSKGKLRGWFYHSYEEWREETGLTKRQVDYSRKKLKKRGVLKCKRSGIPPKVYYRIDLGEILRFLWTSR